MVDDVTPAATAAPVEAPDRRSPSPTTGPDQAERRTMPVAHIWVVGIVCFLVGALLNAQAIYKTALGQPVGWRRDVALLLAEPLRDVSHALLLDRLRLGIQDLIGRSGDDEVDLSLPSPTLDRGEERAEPEPLRAFSPATPMRLWVGGDSLAITPGESLLNAAAGTGVVVPLETVDGRISTGLARPEVFNWPAHLAEVLARLAPDAMVLTLGSNDDQTLTGDGGGQAFGTDGWQAEYRRRVGGLMDQVTSSGTTKLFWVGVPQMANVERFQDRYRLINGIVHEEAKRRTGRVVYVDTAGLLSGPDGGYAGYVPSADGSLVQVRAGDGVHYTRAGGDRVAQAVMAAWDTVFDLTSWRDAVPTTTAVPSGSTSSSSSRPSSTTTTRR